MGHEHSVTDKNTHYIIDPATRTISGNPLTLMQNDHNSERVTFELAREIEGHDMNECNAIEVHYTNAKADKTEESKGVYECTDLVLDEDGEKVICSWLISGNATKLAGKLSFRLKFLCRDENGNITYAWNTASRNDFTVGAGEENGEAIAEEFPDVIGALDARIGVLEEGGNAVKSVNGVEPDESGNVAVEIPEGFGGSWNDLTDKPEIGIQIKKIVFTDRPSLWEWLQANYTKISNVKLWTNASQCVDDMLFIGHGAVGKNQLERFSFYTMYPRNLATPAELDITISRVEVSHDGCYIHIYSSYDILNDEIDSAGQDQEVPDEYWSTMGIKATIYYFDE